MSNRARNRTASKFPQIIAIDENVVLFDDPDWYKVINSVQQSTDLHTSVVLYIRISKDRPNETSTATQEAEGRAFAEMMGWTVVAVFSDIGKSAFDTSVKRPGLNDAMAMLANGKANRLLVWKLDRFMRNANEFMNYHQRIRTAGAVFASVKEPWFDTATPIGIALVVLMSALAQMEAENIRMRIQPYWKRRHEHRMTPVGVAPFGFRRPKGKRNTLAVEQSEATALLDAATAFLSGSTLRGIARDLNEKGHTTAAGKPFTHLAVTRALRTPTIAALHELPDGTLLASDQWEPIIDPDTYLAIQQRLADPSRRIHLEGVSCEPKWMLSGVLRCGRCVDARFKTKPHGDGRRYQCRECGNSIEAESCEAFITDALFGLIDGDAWSAMRNAGRKADASAIDRMRKALDHERSKYFDGSIDQQQWDDFQRDYRDRMETLEDADAIELPEVADVVASWPDLDATSKKMVLNAVFESIVIHPVAKGCSGTKRIDIAIAS